MAAFLYGPCPRLGREPCSSNICLLLTVRLADSFQVAPCLLMEPSSSCLARLAAQASLLGDLPLPAPLPPLLLPSLPISREFPSPTP